MRLNRHARRRARVIQRRGFRVNQMSVAITGECLEDAVLWLLKTARTATPGWWAESFVNFTPPCVFAVDFDGQGGILVNPESLEHATGRAIFAELRRLGGDRVREGTWQRGPGGEAA
mgnify:CR=1 FL=1